MYWCNPRFPLITELKQIMLDSYYGNKFSEEKNIFLLEDEKSDVVKEST